MVQNLDQHISETEAQIAKLEQQIEEEKASRAAATEGQSREELITEHKGLAATNKQLREEIRQYEKCDPAKLEEVKQKVKTCKDAGCRWTDNLFELESWMKKNNPGLSSEELYQNFPILEDLDYPPM